MLSISYWHDILVLTEITPLLLSSQCDRKIYFLLKGAFIWRLLIIMTTPVGYNEDLTFKTIHCFGEGNIVIEPGKSGDAVVWNSTSYSGGTYSPFLYPPAGTWDIKEDTRPSIIKGSIELKNTKGVEFRGIKIDGDDDNNCVIMNSQSYAKMTYCHFYGEKCACEVMANSVAVIENSYFQENRMSVFVGAKSWLTLEGDIYIENAWQYGIYALMDSIVQISPWNEMPLEHFTTEIKTTGARKKYYAVKAIEKSFIKIWNGLVNWGHPFCRSSIS